MKKIYFNELENHLDEEIVLAGWVENVRVLQYVIFMILTDNTGKVQVTIERETASAELIKQAEEMGVYSTVKVKGKLVKNEKVKLNGMELIPADIIVTSTSCQTFPIDMKDKEKSLLETRLDYRFLDLRKEENNLIFRVQTTLLEGMRKYFQENNFIEIMSPKISGASAESGAEVFKLKYFDKDACLSQSPQFYKQMAMAAGFNKVFEIGPAFRAEASHTSYHTTEISMVDMEVSWLNNVEELMMIEEEWIKCFMDLVYERHHDEILEKLKIDIKKVDYSFPRITFAAAKKLLTEKYNYIGSNLDDLERKEEELLCEYAQKEYNSEFIFVTNYPMSARPFYHQADENGRSKSYDLLYKGLEITTGAIREHRADILTKQVIDKGIKEEELSFYLDFFKYGCPPHGGFGFGLARILMKLLERESVREVIYLYRGPNRLNP